MYAKAKDIVSYHHPSNVNIILLEKIGIPCRADREAYEASSPYMISATGSLLRYFGQIEFQVAHLLDHLEKLLAIKCFRHNWPSSLKLFEGVFTINKHKIWNK